MESSKEKIGAVVVCGAGIAGIQAALDMADSGFRVYLTEASPSIGGRMALLDKTFPTGDCAMCILSPKLVECARHPNIEVFTLTDIEEVTGNAGNFTVRLRRKPRYVDEAKCTACGDCVEACPVRLPNEWNKGLDTRAAVFTPYPQAVPNVFAISKRERPPCIAACPLDQNVPAYIALVAAGKFAEAARVIRETNPFPGLCGYVCHRPCETECQRSRFDEPVSIRGIKRFVADWQDREGVSPPPEIGESRPERVAVVGSGPAGLSAAHWLRLQGYGVDVFEATDKPGGMMRAGVPAFRLPREILDREIDRIVQLGVRIHTNFPIGDGNTIPELMQQRGYNAVFIAAGAHRSIPLRIHGEDLRGVRPGIEFIREANLGETTTLGRRVVVIGGGNAALDAARIALRNGAGEVTILYRRSRREMPADPDEVQEALREGVKLVFLASPVAFVGENGRLKGIRCVRMRLSEELDRSGRRRPVPIEGSEFVVECDDAIVTIGQSPDPLFNRQLDVRTDKSGLVVADPVTLATDKPGVFAGGDVVAGAGTLSEAIAAGRRAAESIHRYLNGQDLAEGRAPPRKPWDETKHRTLDRALADRGIPKQPRLKTPAEGYNPDQVVEEAARCLSCGLCCECMQCVEACQPRAILHDQKEETIELKAGAVILAPGLTEFDARIRGEFGHGRHPNVVTNVQFERMLSAAGPYGGQLRRPSDSEEPKRIAFIQCVGSRDAVLGNRYCSAFCCMAAIKEAIIVREHSPNVQVTVFYTDIRAYGKGFDRYYERAKEEYGIEFIRGMISRVVELPRTKNLRVSYVPDEGERVDREFDMVVLSAGLQPGEQVKRIAENLHVRLNEFGFCQTSPLEPVRTSREGIFVAGVFQEPKDIPETVMQGSAAAAGAMQLLSDIRGDLVAEKVYPPEHDFTDATPRVGVFICHCGVNISSVVDVERVVEAARQLPFVEHAESDMYTCSDNSQERIKEVVVEKGLNRLLVASCTPRTHLALFRETAREVGLNPFLVEMANIREQCSWVHAGQPRAATEKAIELTRMAAARAVRLTPRTPEELPVVRSALILGGGASGMTAALSLASQGFDVHLVEKEDRLGGNLCHLHYTLEGDDVDAFREKLIHAVTSADRIKLHLGSQLVSVEGHPGDFVSTIATPEGENVEINHGVLILATGAKEFETGQFLHGEDPRVITQRELEERIARGDSVLGERDTVVMIQCVGSRDGERPYCSRVCCAQAVKNALKIKATRPEATVVVLYRDMRTYGFQETEYQRAREAGVLFFRYDPDMPPSVIAGEELAVEFDDPITGQRRPLRADLVVLSTAIVPAEDNPRISEVARLPLDEDGFFLEAHPKLRPVDFATEGVFLCGLAQSPKLLKEAIFQGIAAAGRATTILSRNFLVAGGEIAWVDVEKCVSCMTCTRVCPYGAPTMTGVNSHRRIEIDPARCMGCGSCAAECPARAIQLHNFTDSQITAAIAAMSERG
jgi:heterodisulfide reductase subunit A-like polyferredoxin